MKNMILLGVVAIVLFSISAGISLFLNTSKTPVEETKTADTGKKSKVGDLEGEKPLVRPSVNSGAEDTSKLANQLRDQLSSVKDREAKLDSRQKQVEIILQDIRAEREALDRLRQQVGNELKLVAEKSSELDKKYTDIENEKKNLVKGNADLSKTRIEIDKDERMNLTKMAGLYDTMAPENAAKILQQMADGGKMDTAVKVLAQMKPAKASRVLSEMPDAALAAQLLEKMKGLKPMIPATTTPEG